MSVINVYSQKYNAFSRQLLESFYASGKDQNVVFSPFSILMMLAIAADATAGNTRNQIAHVLSDNMGFDDVISTLKEIRMIKLFWCYLY